MGVMTDAPLVEVDRTGSTYSGALTMTLLPSSLLPPKPSRLRVMMEVESPAQSLADRALQAGHSYCYKGHATCSRRELSSAQQLPTSTTGLSCGGSLSQRQDGIIRERQPFRRASPLLPTLLLTPIRQFTKNHLIFERLDMGNKGAHSMCLRIKAHTVI